MKCNLFDMNHLQAGVTLFSLAYPTKSFALFPSQQPSNHLLFSLRIPQWFDLRRRKTIILASRSTSNDDTLRVGILGGGIAGVSVAHALVQKGILQKADNKCQIVVFEGDPYACSNNLNKPVTNQWQAATARNANSMVPAAAMHVFSEKSALWSVLRDTLVEFYELKREQLQSLWPSSTQNTIRSEQFSVPPPYFALHLWKCIGPTASSAERWSFITFMKHYLYASLWKNDANERGKQLVALASANRNIFLKYSDDKTPFARGFLSLHRTAEAAQHALDEIHEHGENAEIIPWDKAIQLEPRLSRLPMEPLFSVHRTDDIIASCGSFIKSLVEKCQQSGVTFRNKTVRGVVEVINESKPKYRVTFEDGLSADFDIVVLAAGIRNPLLAAGMGLGEYVPLYPLRGYSFTLFASRSTDSNDKFLNKPFSVDSIYCSSVTPASTRMAGFGEFVGYPEKATDVPSLGPPVLARYGRTMFPDATNATIQEVLPCFRPMSPDDLPLAGEIKPGLFVHGGHGTLGWTLGLATGECVAQAIADRISGQEISPKYFEFADGFKIERSILSPLRFVR